MKYLCECALEDFEAWSGGKDTLDTLREKGDCEAVECLIEDLQMCDEPWTKTVVNDFLWFERDAIAEHLGYYNWEEYEYGKSEDKEEDDDDD